MGEQWLENRPRRVPEGFAQGSLIRKAKLNVGIVHFRLASPVSIFPGSASALESVLIGLPVQDGLGVGQGSLGKEGKGTLKPVQ